MRKIIMSLSLLIIGLAQAQDTAMLKVQVQTEDLKALEGEQILFKAQNSSYKTKGISDENGIFRVALLGGETYNIQLKTIGEAVEYNTIAIPPLEPNTKYGENLLTITLFPPKQFTLDNVLFETGKSTLKSASKKELDELNEYLSLKKEIKIQIAGHTDDVGDTESNQKLSENRAKAVKAYLVEKGIASERLSTVGYGASRPIADNASAEGRKLNRRTEVLVEE